MRRRPLHLADIAIFSGTQTNYFSQTWGGPQLIVIPTIQAGDPSRLLGRLKCDMDSIVDGGVFTFRSPGYEPTDLPFLTNPR